MWQRAVGGAPIGSPTGTRPCLTSSPPSARQEKLAELSGAGFEIVTRDGIASAAGEDEQLAAEVAAFTGADPPQPIAPTVYAKLLQKLFSVPAPEELPELVAEEGSPIADLIKVERGPRCFKVFVNDFPSSNDVAAIEASLEGGTLDYIVLLTAPPPPPPKPEPEEGDEAAGEAAEPPPEPSEEEKAEREQFLAEGRQREQLFADLQILVATETSAQSSRSHKVLANVCFDTMQLAATEPDDEAYCDADASMAELGRKFLQTIRAKLDWLQWIRPLRQVETVPEDINLRHYDERLRACPASAVSVALILNALIEQVELLHPYMDKTNLSQTARGFEGGATGEAAASHSPVGRREAKAIAATLEEALYSLNAELPKRNHLVLNDRRMDLPLDLQGDKQTQRMGAPKMQQVERDSLVSQEQAVVELLDLELRAHVPAVHPEVPGMTEAQKGLEMTELITMLPHELTPSQIRRGLIVAEMERLVNFRTDQRGEPVNIDAWFMEELDLSPYCMVEEHHAEALKQILRESLHAPTSCSPTVRACYYARDDLVLAVVCNLVPFSRSKNLQWRAVDRRKGSAPCFLGFWQWLETRFMFRKEDNEEREAQEQARLAELQAGLDEALPAQESAGDVGEGGEEGEEEELSEEEIEARRKQAEEKEAERRRLQQLKEALPELDVPASGAWYEMDAKKATQIRESRDVCFLSHGPRVCVTKAAGGRVLTVDSAKHVLVMRQDQDSSFKLTLTYEDGACALARRENGQTVVSLSLPEGLMVTLRSDGTVWQSRPTSKPVEGVNPAAEQKRLDWSTHATNTDMVPKPRGQLVVEGDVGGSLADKAAVTSCALVGQGNVVLWHSDGECDILMPNGCCAQSLGAGCGWLWTNSKGQRQIRGAPRSTGPIRAPSVSVETRVQPETGEIIVSRGDYVLKVTRRDGTELVMHRDGTEMVTYPAGADDAAERRNIKVSGMAPIETGPNSRQTRLTMQDGSTLCLIPGLGGGPGILEVRRRDGSVLQVAVQGGKVTLVAEGQPLDLGDEAAAAGDSKSRRSGASRHKSAIDGQSVKSGKSGAGGGDGGTARSASVKSFKSGKSGKTEGDSVEEKPPGTYSMSLVTGSLTTNDHAGNTYSINSKGEIKMTVQAQVALKQRNADAISAADEARNKMAMEAGSMEDMRPPSPKIESEPGPRLEPYRLFVVRRDGSGYELVHERIGRMNIKVAAEHGRSVVEEPLPAEDEEAGGVSFTILAQDHRYPLGGAAAGLKALSDDLMPPLFKHKGLSSATDPVGARVASVYIIEACG